ncbi:MAG: hypothetical protein M1514_02675 [Patescibacteria group bacterium]|nr:hypothetical protein [Patescibacteria group bacterium]
MPNLSFIIFGLKITPFFWGLVLGLVLGSFLFWRRLRDDYPEDEIFNLTLWLIIASLVFSWLLGQLFEFLIRIFIIQPLPWAFHLKFSFAGAVLGVIFVIVFKGRNLKKNFWEIFDTLVLPFLYLILLGGLGLFFKQNYFFYLIYSFVGLLGLIVYPLVQRKYRSFSWYKSGKTGFLATSFSFLVFFIFFLLAFWQRNILYWEHYSWLVIALCSLGALYYRSERNFKEDLWRK